VNTSLGTREQPESAVYALRIRRSMPVPESDESSMIIDASRIHPSYCRLIINSRPPRIRNIGSLTSLLRDAYKQFLQEEGCSEALSAQARIYEMVLFPRFALNLRSAFFDEVGRQIFLVEYLIVSLRATPESLTLNSALTLSLFISLLLFDKYLPLICVKALIFIVMWYLGTCLIKFL